MQQCECYWMWCAEWFLILRRIVLPSFCFWTPESPWLSGIQMCAMVFWPGHIFVSEHVYMCSFICVLGTRESGAQHGCDKDGTWVWQWHRTNTKWIWVNYCQTGRFICPIMHCEDWIKGKLPYVLHRGMKCMGKSIQVMSMLLLWLWTGHIIRIRMLRVWRSCWVSVLWCVK